VRGSKKLAAYFGSQSLAFVRGSKKAIGFDNHASPSCAAL